MYVEEFPYRLTPFTRWSHSQPVRITNEFGNRVHLQTIHDSGISPTKVSNLTKLNNLKFNGERSFRFNFHSRSGCWSSSIYSKVPWFFLPQRSENCKVREQYIVDIFSVIVRGQKEWLCMVVTLFTPRVRVPIKPSNWPLSSILYGSRRPECSRPSGFVFKGHLH